MLKSTALSCILSESFVHAWLCKIMYWLFGKQWFIMFISIKIGKLIIKLFLKPHVIITNSFIRKAVNTEMLSYSTKVSKILIFTWKTIWFVLNYSFKKISVPWRKASRLMTQSSGCFFWTLAAQVLYDTSFPVHHTECKDYLRLKR